MIYLDNAATTIHKPDCVVEAVAHAMQNLGNCGRGANGGSLSAARVIYQAREAAAALFHLDSPERVCFTCNSTEALNTAILGLIGPEDHVISTDLEHNSVLRPLYHLMKSGTRVSFLQADPSGNVDVSQIEALIRENTKAVICTHASNVTGNLINIQLVGEIARRHGLLFILDASQTAGSFDINMERDHISVLCFTGHKGLMGPQGTGGLCIAKGVDIRPLKMGGTGVQTNLPDQPSQYPIRLEAGTLNSHGIAGLKQAIEYIQETGITAIHEKEHELMLRFYHGVKNVDGVKVYGDFFCDRAPIVALNIEGYDSGEIGDILWEDFQIAVRSGAHCAPRMHQALGTVEMGAVRFSFGWFNTQEEVDLAVAAIRQIAGENQKTDGETLADQMGLITAYIRSHYRDEITLEEIAGYFGVSREYFSRFFKKQTGVNFIRYVHLLRLEHIHEDILSGNDSIMDIAARHGFHNYKLFTKMFREVYGCGPRDLRKAKEEGTIKQ